jgi:hypothetical protein
MPFTFFRQDEIFNREEELGKSREVAGAMSGNK